MTAPTKTHGLSNRQLAPAFSAIDLGTNNCRLLVAVPQKAGFRVIDAFSQIVRLGEGLTRSGELAEAAMDRTIGALNLCADKIAARQVLSMRNIATEACRAAANGETFLKRIAEETGLQFDIVTAEEEASLSVRGCTDLIDPAAKAVLVFDIGGGSTELSWLRIHPNGTGNPDFETVAWVSLPMGVVSVAESHIEVELTAEQYDTLAGRVMSLLQAVDVPDDIKAAFAAGEAHLIGTSGTVTSMAGVHLRLDTYSRRAVDGLWMGADEARRVAELLRRMDIEDRALSPCIGRERADLVVGGCAILEGILRAWPTDRIRVGDRGLREGLLLDLIAKWRNANSVA
ncbi:Ppx/GppA phosphatase family protein [Parvularcula marina]|uniref:Ppx/GppA phosphatase family protein n=1 Tax=Parvularcula marina TaxID=2292771 RepID=UPI003518CB18